MFAACKRCHVLVMHGKSANMFKCDECLPHYPQKTKKSVQQHTFVAMLKGFVLIRVGLGEGGREREWMDEITVSQG